MSVEKTSLTSLRSLLFFVFGGIGCLLPYLTLHIRATGLSVDEARLVSIVSPLLATIGPIGAGPLVDYLSGNKRKQKTDEKNDNNACIRTVLSTSVLLSAIFYCLLLSVPTVVRLQPRQPEVSFVCNEDGASLVQEKCNEIGCYHFPQQKTGQIQLRNCKFNCDFPMHHGYIEPSPKMLPVQNPAEIPVQTSVDLPDETTKPDVKATSYRSIMSENGDLDGFFGTELNELDDDEGDFGSGEESDFDWSKRQRRDTDDFGILIEESPRPPHICYTQKIGNDPTSKICNVYTTNTSVLKFSVTLKPVHEDDEYCSYQLGDDVTCRIPAYLEQPNQSCKVMCDMEDAYSSESVMQQSQCEQSKGNPDYTFWLYLTLRTLGDLFTAVTVSLLIGATLVAARLEIGREFILPSVAYGLFAILVGYLHSEALSPLKLDNIPNFFLGIVGFGLLSMLAVFVLIFATDIPIGPPDWWWTTRNVQVRHKGELCTLLLILVLMGALWGPIYSHVPWHITDTKGLELYIGCSTAMGALLSIPVVWKAETIIDYCGYSNVLISAFTFYILRYTGLLFVQNPWVLLITGGMEIFTMCLMIFSAILYVRHLVPKHLTFTSQCLAVAAHFCLGNGLGCLASTFLSPSAAQVEANLQNTTTVIKEELKEEEEVMSIYHYVYCVGAVSSAAVAVLYFILYHCCLKKRCLAPPYRKKHNNTLVQDPAGNGSYTPLRVYHNGRQPREEVVS